MRGVAGLLERLRERAFVERQTVLCPWTNHTDLQAVANRITARQQRRARGRADRQHVKLFQLRAAARERVEMGRLDFAAVPADIRPAQVIGEEVDDVRLVSGDRRWNAVCQQAKRDDDKSKQATHADRLHASWRTRNQIALPHGVWMIMQFLIESVPGYQSSKV